MKKFQTNQIVSGKAAGTFMVLGYRELFGRTFVRVRPYDPKAVKFTGVEMAFDESALTEWAPTK